jgi:hypothetical protein
MSNCQSRNSIRPHQHRTRASPPSNTVSSTPAIRTSRARILALYRARKGTMLLHTQGFWALGMRCRSLSRMCFSFFKILAESGQRLMRNIQILPSPPSLHSNPRPEKRPPTRASYNYRPMARNAILARVGRVTKRIFPYSRQHRLARHYSHSTRASRWQYTYFLYPRRSLF